MINYEKIVEIANSCHQKTIESEETWFVGDLRVLGLVELMGSYPILKLICKGITQKINELS